MEDIQLNHPLEETSNISVSARVIYQLGEQLIPDEFMALTELIKNSYDADAKMVKVTVDTQVETEHGKGRITVEDNGNGMTKSIILNSFLRISTNFKQVEKFSPLFNRRTLGEKGLGRLAIQRLGNHVTVYTKPKLDELKLKGIFTEEDISFAQQYDTAKILINWKDFQNSDGDISDMQVQCHYYNDSSVRKGTKLIIEGIRNIDFWHIGRKDENLMRKKIFGLVSPYTQKEELQFKISLNIDGKVISNEIINENTLANMSDIKVNFSLKDWILRINIKYSANYLDRLERKTIMRMRNNGFKVERKSFNSDRLKEFALDLSSENYKLEYPYLKDIILQRKNGLEIAYPGDYQGAFYVLNKDNDAINEARDKLSNNGIVFNTKAELEAIWNAASGVKLFRDYFRIFPYGEVINKEINDWLGFTYRAQRMRSNSYKVHTVSGYVNLDGWTSENIKEQTNRSGLVEDEYGKNFLTIMREFIAEVVVRNDIDLRGEFDVQSFSDKEEKVSTRNGNVIFCRTILEKKNEENALSVSGDLDQLIQIEALEPSIKIKLEKAKDKVKKIIEHQKTKDQYQKQELSIREQRINYLENLIGLAGQGIIVETLTHELHRIEENISHYAKDSKSDLLKLENIKGQFQYIIDKQEAILQQVVFLQQQLEHLEPTYKRNQFRTEKINMKKLITELYIIDSPMANKAKKQNVQIFMDVQGQGDLVLTANKGVLITIFDNLFINSLYWLQDSKQKEIHFCLDERARTITVWDTGQGIHRDREYDLFEPEKSSKPSGRGLGLYIVRELMRYLRGSIRLDYTQRNLYNNLYRFILEFPEEEK